MTLKLIEGFDHFNTQLQANVKGWNAGGSGNTPTFQATGRINGGSLKLHGTTANDGYQSKALPAAYTDIIVGVAFQMSGSLPSSDDAFLRLYAGASLVADLCITSTGKVRVKNGSGTTIATGTATVAGGGVWNYYELKLHLAGASGTCQTQTNGAADIASTTGNFGSTGIDSLRLAMLNASASGVSTDLYFDDLYVVDPTASPNNSFLGDVHVETIFPSADGNHSDWTPNSGTTHYDRVNQSAPDDDTTYNSDSTVGHIDSYAYTDLAILAGTIFAVQTNLWARKDDATVRQVKALIRSAGSDYTPGVAQTLATTYADYTDIQETDPATAAAWVLSGLNAAEFGIKVVT